MELLTECKQNVEIVSGNEELAVFDMVGELLAISLEKHDMEIIVESKDFLIDNANYTGSEGMLRTKIDFEDVVELDGKLEITVSGVVENTFKQQESFTLFLLLNSYSSKKVSLKRENKKAIVENSLWLKFGRKAEQLSDSVFSVHLYQKDKDGAKEDLGQGRGFLVFGRETSFKMN